MVETLTRNWTWILLRGVVAVLFSLLTLFNPGITLLTLVLLFGAYAFVDGVFMVTAAIANRHGQPRWVALLAGGLLSIAAGIITIVTPGVTAVALLAMVGVWALVLGGAEIVAAIRVRKQISGEWTFVLAGVLAVAFGAALILMPAEGAPGMALWIGVYALLSGLLLIGLSLRLRNWGRAHFAI